MDLMAILPNVLLYQLTSPWLFVPAIAVGWFARTRGQLLLGVLAVGLVSIAMTFMSRLPEGGSLVYVLMPTVFISPLVWAFATSRAKARLLRDSSLGPRDGMRVAARAVIGAVIGAPVGGALGALIGSIAADLFRVSNFEGQAGYFVAFLFVLPGILIGAVAGAVLLARRR